jgi:hypothetical protein
MSRALAYPRYAGHGGLSGLICDEKCENEPTTGGSGKDMPATA